MGRKKLTKFAETLTFPNFFQPSRDEVFTQGFQWKGCWKDFFKNNNPIVLELCCGRGEYTIGLAKMFPEKNFIGIDRKGARMWQGCKYSIENQMTNVAFFGLADSTSIKLSRINVPAGSLAVSRIKTAFRMDMIICLSWWKRMMVG